MFKYSCSETLLINWILGQINTHPDAIFPCRKNWKGQLTLYYPSADGISYFLMIITDLKETICFIPLDSATQEAHIKKFQQEKIRTFIKQKIDIDVTQIQVVLMTCEQEKEKIDVLMKKNRINAELLVLYSDKIEFFRGSFNNDVLNYRLSKLLTDPDLIALSIPDNCYKTIQNKARILFFQSLFHVLNKYWLQNQNNIPLDKVISQCVPYWDQFQKKQRKEMIDQVQNALLKDLNIELSEIIKVKSYRKKSESHPQIFLQFRLDAKNKKNITIWLKKQNRALGLIRHQSLQYTSDIYSIIPNY